MARRDTAGTAESFLPALLHVLRWRKRKEKWELIQGSEFRGPSNLMHGCKDADVLGQGINSEIVHSIWARQRMRPGGV